jgi:hypothetical protein
MTSEPAARLACRTCQVEKECGCFEKTPYGYRKECKACRSKRRKERHIEAQKDIEPSSSLPSTHRCIECNRNNVEGARFTRRKDSVSVRYRGKCVDCARKWHDTNRVYLIRYNAARRNIYFDDSKMNDFENMVQLPCHYCGDDDRVCGLDRMNSSLGYTIENVVPCCMVCNLIKGKTMYDKFIENVECIIAANEERIRILIQDGYAYRMTTNFSRSGAPKNDKTCTLTPEEKTRIRERPCYICKKTPSKGIDRFDSKLPYTLENSKPCCFRCNMMKKDFGYEDFLCHCHQMREHVNRNTD